MFEVLLSCNVVDRSRINWKNSLNVKKWNENLILSQKLRYVKISMKSKVFFLNTRIKNRNAFLSKIYSNEYFKILNDSIDEKFDCSCWNFEVSRITTTIMCQIFVEILRTNACLLRRNSRNRKTMNMKTKCSTDTTS